MSLLNSAIMLASNANSKFNKFKQTTGASAEFAGANNSIAYSPTLNLYVVVDSFGSVFTSSDLVTWTSRTNPAGSSFTGLWDVVWGNSIFVAVGDAGTIITSPDGITWTSRTSNTTETLYAIAYNASNTTYVAVGSLGIIRSSTNATTWSSRNSGTTNNLIDVTVNSAGLFVVVGDVGTITTASAVNSWTVRTSNTTEPLFSVTVIGTNYVALTSSGNTVNSANGTTGWAVNAGITGLTFGGIPIAIASSSTLGRYTIVTTGEDVFTSTNGTTWTTAFSQTQKAVVTITGINQVAFLNSQFVTVGGLKIYTSTNGTLWKPTQNSVQLFGEGAYSTSLDRTVVIGEFGTVYTRVGLGTWQYISNIATSNDLKQVIWSATKNLFIAVGDQGTIITSSNGTTWTVQTSGTTQDLLTVTESLVNGTLIVGGKNATILTSSAGTAWAAATVTTANTTYTINSISSSNSTHIASYFNTANNELSYLISSTGSSWAEGSVKILASSACKIKWDQEKFIGIGLYEHYIYSYNGTDWYTSGSFPLNSIAATSTGTLAAVGNKSIIVSTNSGKIWQILPQPTTNNLIKIIWTGQALIAIGTGGTILRSTDGFSWSTITSGTLENLLDIIHVSSNSTTIIVGNNNTVLTSTNHGTSWNSIAGPIATYSLLSIAINTSNNTIIVLAANPTNSYALLPYITTNFGSSWTSSTITQAGYTAEGADSNIIYAKNKFIINASQSYGNMFQSADDGISWNIANDLSIGSGQKSNLTYYALEDIFAIEASSYIMVSKNLTGWPLANGNTNLLNASNTKILGVIGNRLYICYTVGGSCGSIYYTDSSTSCLQTLNPVFKNFVPTNATSFCIANDEYMLVFNTGAVTKLGKSLQTPVQGPVLVTNPSSQDIYGSFYIPKYDILLIPGSRGVIYDVY